MDVVDGHRLGLAVGFRLHGTIGEALLAFGLCLVCGFVFLWVFICIGLVARRVIAAATQETDAVPGRDRVT